MNEVSFKFACRYCKGESRVEAFEGTGLPYSLNIPPPQSSPRVCKEIDDNGDGQEQQLKQTYEEGEGWKGTPAFPKKASLSRREPIPNSLLCFGCSLAMSELFGACEEISS